MGLDMYAHRRVYVKQWEHQKPEERYTVHIDLGGKPVAGFKSERISSVEEEVMYWRKANHIHAWFVDNVQQFDDDCGTYEVEWDKLQDLVDVCRKVKRASKLVDGIIANGEVMENGVWVALREPGKVIEDPTKATELLPTREGFFFGHYAYDEDYLDDLIKTHDWANRMINDHLNGVPGDIYYSSSW